MHVLFMRQPGTTGHRVIAMQQQQHIQAHSQEAMSTATQLPQLCPVQERWQ